MMLLQRYLSGEREAVWADLVALGPRVREPDLFPQALEVARETMRRVRVNIEKVRAALSRAGYEFEFLKNVYVPPAADIQTRIAEVEARRGPLPLSLRAFYEVVGSVDFRQSKRQLVPHSKRKGMSTTPLQQLGEYDPLLVFPFTELEKEAAVGSGRIYFCFAPDEFHKANYSGGENYHLWLPDPCADAPIVGMYGIEETFLTHLRTTVSCGGFRGKLVVPEEESDDADKELPAFDITRKAAEGLEPF